MEPVQEQQTTSQAAPQIEKLSQKDAVFNFTTEALVNAGLSRIKDQPLKDLVTKEIRKVVRQRLFAAISAGEVRVSKTMDSSKLKKYCSGLINNWLKKDERFNK